jgi:hypothetical protein
MMIDLMISINSNDSIKKHANLLLDSEIDTASKSKIKRLPITEKDLRSLAFSFFPNFEASPMIVFDMQKNIDVVALMKLTNFFIIPPRIDIHLFKTSSLQNIQLATSMIKWSLKNNLVLTIGSFIEEEPPL